MLQLKKHGESECLSFQEEHALRWLIKSRGQSSNVNAAISCAFPIDECVLRQSLQAAFAAHDALRTRFTASGPDSFRRLVLPAGEGDFAFVQRQVGDALSDPALAGKLAIFCATPFAFDDTCWLRVLLIRTRDDSCVLAISMPHVVSDAMSIQLLIAGIWRDYITRAEGGTLAAPMPRFSLTDFAASQRAWGETADFRHKLEQLLAAVTCGIENARRELPAKYANWMLPVRPSATVRCGLPEALCAGLRQLALETRVSLQTVLLAGAALATARLFDRRQFCFRLPFANRTAAGAENIVGFLANDMPLSLCITEDQSFRSVIKAVHTKSFAAMRFGAVPWAVLKQQLLLQPALQGTRNPFEDHVINIFPALGRLAAGSAYEARPFPIRSAGFTSNEMKVWLQLVNHRIVLFLCVGADDGALAEQNYLPVFLKIFDEMVTTPDACASKHPRRLTPASLYI